MEQTLTTFAYAGTMDQKLMESQTTAIWVVGGGIIFVLILLVIVVRAFKYSSPKQNSNENETIKMHLADITKRVEKLEKENKKGK